MSASPIEPAPGSEFAFRLHLARQHSLKAALDEINVRITLASEIFRLTRLEEDEQVLQGLTVLQTHLEGQLEARTVQ